MAEASPKPSGSGEPAKKPYGPGVLMVIGLFLVLVAAWCAYDLATREEWEKEGRTGTILFNWAGLVGFGVGALYSFGLAAKRWRRMLDETREEGREPAAVVDGPELPLSTNILMPDDHDGAPTPPASGAAPQPPAAETPAPGDAPPAMDGPAGEEKPADPPA